MKAVLFIISIIITTCLYSQNKPQANLHLIKVGMSKSEVENIIGKPNKIDPYVTLVKGTNDTTTYWNYLPEQTVQFTNGKVSAIEFDKNGMKERWNNASRKKKADSLNLEK